MSNPQRSAKPNQHVYMTGVRLEQLLQLAEVSRKTCTVLIRSGELNGTLHIRDGAVIQAKTDDSSGIDAAFQILSWAEDEPEISMQPPQTNVEACIQEPISLIMLESARMLDENRRDQGRAEAGNVVAYPSGAPVVEAKEDPVAKKNDWDSENEGEDVIFRAQVVAPLVKLAASTPGVDKLALVRRDGTVLAEHNGGEQLGTLLAYLAMETERIRQTLQLSEGRWITLNCEEGDRIVVVLGSQMVLGLTAKASLSPQRLIAKIAPLLHAAALI